MKISKLLKNNLENPIIYNFFEKIAGVSRPRKKFVEEFIKPKENEKILDIGCGTGELLDFFPKKINYLGIDNNFEYIKYAKKKYKDRGEFICSEIGSNKKIIKDEYFDIVMSAGVIHHLDDNSSKKLLEESMRALKKGGRFASFDPLLIKNQRLISRLLVQNDRGNFVRNIKKYENLLKETFKNYKLFHKNDLHYYNYDILIMTAYK
jgi:ubiquinone/menaquinone biosynthesis C-methylase UbiE